MLNARGRYPALFLAILLAISGSPFTLAKEPSGFAETLRFTHEQTDHRLSYTGKSTRVFIVFKVYDIAHYVETGAMATLAPADTMTDGPAKAIAIRFARKLGHDRIKDEFDRSLRRNAKKDWLDAARASITAFINSIDRDARADDQLVFYWLPGGRLYADFNGERAFETVDEAFAKSLWSIWFGEEPACDSEELLAGTVTTS